MWIATFNVESFFEPAVTLGEDGLTAREPTLTAIVALNAPGPTATRALITARSPNPWTQPQITPRSGSRCAVRNSRQRCDPSSQADGAIERGPHGAR